MDRTTPVPPAAAAAGVRSLEEIKEVLKALIEENAGIPASSIKDDSSIDGDLAMDSLSFVSLQVAVDETFGVECEAEEIEKRSRFDAIAQLIGEKLQALSDHSTKPAADGAQDRPFDGAQDRPVDGAQDRPVRVIDGRRH